MTPALFILAACLPEPDPTGFEQLQAQVDALNALVGEEDDQGLRGELRDLQARLDVAESALGSTITLIADDTTLNIPGTAPGSNEPLDDLHGALRWLSTRVIAPDATVTLLLASGTHTLASSVVLRHPNGDRIAIVGASDTVLRAEGVTAIDVGEGGALGSLRSVQIESDGSGAGQTYGLYVHDGGLLRCGSGVVIRGFTSSEAGDYNPTDSAGILVEHGGILRCGAVNLRLEDNRQGVIVRNGATADIQDAQLAGNITYGLWVYSGAQVLASGIQIEGTNNADGVNISAQSYADLSGAEIRSAGNNGVTVTGASLAVLDEAVIVDSHASGIKVQKAATITANSLQVRCSDAGGTESQYDLFASFASSAYVPDLMLGDEAEGCTGSMFPSAFVSRYEDALIAQ